MFLSVLKPPNACTNANVSLGIDQACLSILNQNKISVTFYAIAAECFKCNGTAQAVLPSSSNTTLVVPTRYPLHMYYASDHEHEYCHKVYDFTEHGKYGWNFTNNSCSDIYSIEEPHNPYIPVLLGSLSLVLAWTVYTIIIRLVKKWRLRDTGVQDDLGRLQETESPTQSVIRTTKTSTRIQSIDAFRGIAILLMIFVNAGGGKYVLFNHSAWNGLTIADFVLPWFAWIMGLTITVSKKAELRVSTSRGRIILRCLQRAITLIFLGLIINSQYTEYLKDLRFPGVLQLLGVSYFVCASLETIFMKAHSQIEQHTFIRDFADSWIQWLIVLILIIARNLIIFFLPVPGCPQGYFGPGGYAEFGKYANCTGGAVGYVDRLIFGNHMYRHVNNPVYGTILPHDPEGLLNTISAILIVYLGVQAGKILLLYYQYNSRLFRWLGWAVFIGIIGGALCYFRKEDGLIPINKKMMSLSFVLVTSSLAFLLYAVLYLLIDYKRYWNGAPFIYAGINSIVIYVGHSLTMNLFPWSWKLMEPTHPTLLAMNLWTTICWVIIAYVLYKKDIIITV